MIVEHRFSTFVTCHVRDWMVIWATMNNTGKGKTNASIVGFAHIAIDAPPSIFTLAWFAASENPMIAVRERATLGSETVYATPTGRALALAIVLVADAKLTARGGGEKAIKTRGTFISQSGGSQ